MIYPNILLSIFSTHYKGEKNHDKLTFIINHLKFKDYALMYPSVDLTNHFLIAMPKLTDPNFNQTVTYIFEHNQEGVVGVIINRPMTIDLEYALQQLDINTKPILTTPQPICFGGPLQQDRGFVIHPPFGTWRSSLALDKHLAITTSQDILRAIAIDEGPSDHFIALGYAAWDDEQLEQEITDNYWLITPASSEVIFNTPFNQRWEKAAQLLGVNINTITSQTGHG